jgi:uncharacterized membrane protein YccC
MLRRPWRLLPAYVINGIAVAVGIGCIQLLASALAGGFAAQLVVSGAVCASLPDVPNSVTRTWHRVAAAALLSSVAALTVDLLRAQPLAFGVALGVVAFCAMMTMSWGVRATAVSFSPILSMVFSMAVPPTGHALAVAGWSACGGVAYLAWAMLSSSVLQRRYRTLALTDALGGAAQLFQSRAAVLEAARSDSIGGEPIQAWIRGEAALADRLQSARDLLFAADDTARWRRDTAILLRVIDLRDILLASPLDVELLGNDATSRAILTRVAGALRDAGDEMERAADAVRLGEAPTTRGASRVDFDGQLAGVTLPAGDARARLIPALQGRTRQIDNDVERIHRLLEGREEPLPLTHEQLQQFVAAEGWPLRALRAQWSIDSPVLRHAVRTAFALAAAYYLALVLPWGSHPYWLVLSVAVVLRGTLGDTLARRNARVIGTMLGCLVVVGLAALQALAFLKGLFLVALGVAHAFAAQRYWLTATAASVMALLQSHLVNPDTSFPIAERVGDTILGALLAWSFSYVLPSWERRSARMAIGRICTNLQAYAAYALKAMSADPVGERLARRQAYDALQALGVALQRSHVEPKGVRLPAREISALLDHGERLMAHLSMVRLLLAQVGDRTPSPEVDSALADAYAALSRQLDLQTPAPLDLPVDDPGGLELLPLHPATHDMLPWLKRRLRLLVHEASRMRQAAAMAQGPGDRPP